MSQFSETRFVFRRFGEFFQHNLKKTHVQRNRNPSTFIFKRLGTSAAHKDQNPNVGDQKLEKCEGVCRVLEPVFLEWKNQGTRCKETFENWLRIKNSLTVFKTVNCIRIFEIPPVSKRINFPFNPFKLFLLEVFSFVQSWRFSGHWLYNGSSFNFLKYTLRASETSKTMFSNPENLF